MRDEHAGRHVGDGLHGQGLDREQCDRHRHPGPGGRAPPAHVSRAQAILTKGTADRTAAWDRLSAPPARFRHLELLFSTIWGVALPAECAARLAGACTLPVTTMVWLGTAFTLGAIGLAMVVSGLAAGPMQRMIRAAATVPEGAR